MYFIGENFIYLWFFWFCFNNKNFLRNMIDEYSQCIESSIHLPKLVWKIFFKMSLASKKANEENPKWLITI